MHPEIRDHVIESVYTALADIEKVRGQIIGVRIRSFIIDVVLESLQLRADEWRQAQSLDVEDPNHAGKIADIVITAVKRITDDVPVHVSKGGNRHALLIGVLQRAQGQWCNIFPFCR